MLLSILSCTYLPSIYLFSSIKYMFISFPHFLFVLFLLWLGGCFFFFVFFFFFNSWVFPDFRDLMYLDPTFSSAYCLCISGGDECLDHRTQQTRLLAVTGPCFPARVACSDVSGRWRRVWGPQGQLIPPPEQLHLSFLIHLVTCIWQRRESWPRKRRRVLSLDPYFWWNCEWILHAICVRLAWCCQGNPFHPGKKWAYMSCLLLVNQGLRSARFVWPSAGWRSQEAFPLCYFSSPEVPNQLTILTSFRLLCLLSLDPFSGFVIVLSEEKQSKMGLYQHVWTESSNLLQRKNSIFWSNYGF